LLKELTSRLEDYIVFKICVRLVSATGNCFPETVHVGCVLLSYDKGEPQASHRRQILPNKAHSSDTSTCTTKLGMNAKVN